METVTIQGLELRVGDRVHIYGSPPFPSETYALKYISPDGDYVTFKRSPRPDILRSGGFGQRLSFFSDKLLRKMQRGVTWLYTTPSRDKVTAE